ncbi:hypothetical protein ACJW30_11G186100 [Castanea mollissima]
MKHIRYITTLTQLKIKRWNLLKCKKLDERKFTLFFFLNMQRYKLKNENIMSRYWWKILQVSELLNNCSTQKLQLSPILMSRFLCFFFIRNVITKKKYRRLERTMHGRELALEFFLLEGWE